MDQCLTKEVYMVNKFTNKKERGATLIEFAIGATVLLTSMFAIVEVGRLLWTHNALRDAARRGARYATVRKNDAAGQLAVRNVVVYGDPNGGSTPMIPGLTTGQVNLDYQNYNGIQLSSRATVSISNYQFKFAVPLVGGTLTLPSYRTSLPGESAGNIPCDIASGTPEKPCNIIPN
jgi:Flp pilus assembly protein TadG